MSTHHFLKTFALWFLLVVLAIVNGTLREKVLIPALGASTAMQISGVTLSLSIFLVSWLAMPWLGPLPSPWFFFMGLMWLLMTLAFEFGFGHFIAHKSRAELLDAYNFSKGNLWVIVLLATFISPWLAAKLRGYV